MLRDRLLARLAAMGDAPDYQTLAAEVLGIAGAPPALARRLVEQALVLEDKRGIWREAGERIASTAPTRPGVYVLRDRDGRAVYVGKAVNLRRRLRAHFAGRNWRRIGAAMASVRRAEWTEVGSELEALLREADLIARLAPIANVQRADPALDTRAIPGALVRDTIVLAPSIEADSVELVAARPDGEWLIQRTRRGGEDLRVHSTRLLRFFAALLPPESESLRSSARSSARGGGAPRAVIDAGPRLAPIVYSWLAGRGSDATRIDPHDAASRRDLAARLLALFRDERLFVERLDQRRA